MPKIAYQYEYQTDMKDIELTPHKRRRSAGVGRDEDTDILSRRGSRCLRCLKPARREREALEKGIAWKTATTGLVPSCT